MEEDKNPLRSPNDFKKDEPDIFSRLPGCQLVD